MDLDAPWKSLKWIEHTQILLNSYERWLGQELISRTGSTEQQAEALFQAPFVVASHDTSVDPVLNYGNQLALELWEADLESFLKMPSRLTAEPMEREERAEMLARTTAHGYIDDYEGIRISVSGKRFHIKQATVWNLVNPDGSPAGQAATFREWTFL